MPRPLPFTRPLLLALTLLLPACLERKESVTLNPDGSGKALIDTLFTLPPVPGVKPDATIMGKQMATQMIVGARGVDAWKDLAIDVAPDGRAHVSVTAYFPDISKFRLDSPFTTTWTKDATGNFTLIIKKDNPANPPAPPAMTDAQVAAAITAAKADYKQNQPAMQLGLGDLKIATTFTLPGTVSATNILTKAPDANTVTLLLEGKPMLAAMDKIMADDKLLTTAIRAGNDSPIADDLLTQNIFGKPGPISATVTGPTKDLFDYKAESAAAKSAQPDMFKKLGINPTPPTYFPGMSTPPQ